MTTQYVSFKINGFTDAHTQCDRCGRNELKGTYNITTEQGQNLHMGSSCIKSAWQMNDKEFEKSWFAPYKTRLSLAKDEFCKIAETGNDRAICDAARKAAAIKYGIKNQYEI